MAEMDVALRARALARLRAAMSYWIATTRPDGRPHAAPVWGVWLDDALWFGTMGQKVRNLDAIRTRSCTSTAPTTW